MRRVIINIIVITLIGQGLLSGQNHSINFLKISSIEAFKLAKSSHKLVFIDCYTEWCGPCKNMEKTVFTNDSVADYYNNNFINVRMDMEKEEGPHFKSKFSIGFYPSFLFLEDSDMVVHRSIGAKNTRDFISLGKNALNPEKNFRFLTSSYLAGKKNPVDIYNYAIACYEAGIGFEANEYFVTQPEDSLINNKNWYLISLYTSVTSSREFKYLADHRLDFTSKYGEYNVNDKIFRVLENELVFRNFDEKDKPVDEIIKEIMDKTDIDIKNVFSLKLKLFYYRKLKGDVKSWLPVAENYVSLISPAKMDSNELNDICQTFYINFDDKDILIKPGLWLEEKMKHEDNFMLHNTYAHILFKSGRYDQALKVAGEAVRMAETTGTDCSSAKELIEQIKNKK